jgi:hypothetical protein
MKTMCGICKTPMDQNPFNSMYFAVQAMAELATGALVMFQIQKVVNIDACC